MQHLVTNGSSLTLWAPSAPKPRRLPERTGRWPEFAAGAYVIRARHKRGGLPPWFVVPVLRTLHELELLMQVGNLHELTANSGQQCDAITARAPRRCQAFGALSV